MSIALDTRLRQSLSPWSAFAATVFLAACSTEGGDPDTGTPFRLCVDNTCSSIDSQWFYSYNNSSAGQGFSGGNGPAQDATGISTVTVAVQGANTGFTQAYSPVSIVQFSQNYYTGGCNPLTANTPPLAGVVIPVGPDKPHTTVQAAIDHAPGVDTVIQLSKGTYAPFEIRGYPAHARTLAITSEVGAHIDTTLGPVRVSTLAPEDVVFLHGLSIGSTASPSTGIEIQDVDAGSLVLSALQVSSQLGRSSIQVRNSTRVSLQEVVAESLAVEGASQVRACSGALRELELTGHSQLITTGMTIDRLQVEQGASLLDSGTPTPLLEVPPSFGLEGDSEILVQAAPGSSWELYAGREVSWATDDTPTDPLASLPPQERVLLASGVTNSDGRSALPVAGLPGWNLARHLVLQAVVHEPGARNSCKTNLQVTVPLPRR